MFGIAIELRGECPHCGNPVMVNALGERIHCPSCLRDQPYPWSEWRDLLDNAWELRPGTGLGKGGNTTVLGANWHLLYARFDPYCFACKHDFDMDAVMASVGPYACPACGERWQQRAAPADARVVMPWLRWLVAEDPEQLPGRGPDTPAPAGAKPILFACMACGGALEVDGSERVITCGFCDASNYLPDDLWLRMHPVETVRRWFMCVDEALLPAGDGDGDEEDDADEDFFGQDEAVARQEFGLAEMLDEIDPEIDLTLEGEDDPAAGEPAFRPQHVEPSTGRSGARPRGDQTFWLMMAVGVLVILGSVGLWFAVVLGAGD
jgi:Zn finger protein HypA/HybF involved in hydrogenase expression